MTMAPSRGDEGQAAVEQQGNSALINAKRNLKYFWSPTTATDQPGRLRTRALLRSFRYISLFVFWRVVRWAKYAAFGALVAAVGATAVGSVVSGVAWIAAPPTIFTGAFAAAIWGMGKFIARRAHKRWKASGGDAGEEIREIHSDSPVRSEGSFGQDVGPQIVPW